MAAPDPFFVDARRIVAPHAAMVIGAILAGGQARRFGSDKALAMLSGEPLIAHVARALAGQVDTVLVVGRPWGGATIGDRPGPGLGPLAAINAALHTCAARGAAAVLSVPCDTPVLPADLRARLDHGDAPAFVADMPVIGWWPVRLAAGLDAWLAGTGSRSVRAWARAIGAVEVPRWTPIANVNTREDLALLKSTRDGKD